ncbi:MAG: anti-sigma factor antagonist [Actinomycetota bacterium]|jgi:anti-anti-sigma factor|nr:anti-sigma factor antagonist [Actinomycetota bacterium]
MGFVPQFSATTDSRDGVVGIALTGELDMASLPALEGQLATSERDGATSIMLDLRDLTFLDYSGVHALLRARHRADANGHRLTLAGASLRTRRLFALTGTEFLLDEQPGVSALRPSVPPTPSQDIRRSASHG